VLSPNNDIEFVDFSKKGRSQFLDQLKSAIADFQEYENLSPQAEPELTESEIAEKEKNDILDVIIEQEELFEERQEELLKLEEIDKNELLQAQNEKLEKTKEKQTDEIKEAEFSKNDSPQETEREIAKNEQITEQIEKPESNVTEVQETVEELETVMNQGLGFISGLFKMATGKSIATQEQSISVDKKTGEVVMKFKLPL